MLVVIMGYDGDKKKVGHSCVLRVISVASGGLRWTLDVLAKGRLLPWSAYFADGWITLTFSLPHFAIWPSPLS